MSVTAIVGANWGDEGKGKTTDFFAKDSDYVVRYQGGNNAGHTIINEYGKFALHLLPSGVFFPQVTNILGPGVAVNIEAFLKELNRLKERGVPSPRILISGRAQVVMPYHILFDSLEENRLADKKFGSTKSGIAPFYADKYMKIGVQVSDLFSKDRLSERISAACTKKNVLLKHLYDAPPIEIEKTLEEMYTLGEKIREYAADTTKILNAAYRDKKKIVLEGQLGALRDPDHGIYPYPTSSSTLAGFASVGAGLPPYSISQVVAVVKAYSSCVGAGPFTTELSGQAAEELRKRGGDAGEYGATTGRPRRVGWFDCVATRYGCMVQGATEAALTNLDVLGYLSSIPVCTGYQLSGKEISDFPVPLDLDAAEPVLTELRGWQQDISSLKRYEDLPVEARDYVEFIEDTISVPITWISIGPHRDQMIRRSN
jgi:adenylosuccinate synthase